MVAVPWRWNRGLQKVVFSVLLLAILTIISWGGPLEAEEALSPEALEIANQLNCPVCQGQSVRDSNSELARQMRQLIQEKLDQGQSREQILQYFVDRYGLAVLREPPQEGHFWLLWWGPVIGLVLGAGLLALYLWRNRTAQRPEEPSLASSELEWVERVLKREEETR